MLKPEDGRLSGYVLLPRFLTEWRCLTSQDDVGTGGAEAYLRSGTTCLAARDAGRKYVGIEINPEYVEIINRRLGLANTSCQLRPDEKDNIYKH